MIPIFKAGDPLSAGKFNALGDSIRHLSENVSTAGEMMVPQHFDALPQPEMDFQFYTGRTTRGPGAGAATRAA